MYVRYLKVLPTGLWVVVYEFYGEKACSELADFYKEYSQKKNRYVSVEFVEMSVRNIWFGRIIKIEMF